MNRFLILSLAVLVASCGRKDGEIPLWKAVRDDIPVELSVRYVGSATSPNDSVYVTQGAVCDGKYAYFAYYSKNVRTREMERWGMVSKYLFEKDTLIHIADSPLFKGSHVNSLALDPKSHRLYASGWAVNKAMSRKSLIVLDTRTLEVLPEQETPDFFLTAITYNSDRKRFFARSGMKLPIYDRDFNLIDVKERADSSIYTTQGLGSDSHYCYFPVSKSAKARETDPHYDNHLLVYDWEGHFIKTLVLDFPHESEDLFTRGDHVYVNFARASRVPGIEFRHAVYEIVAKPLSKKVPTADDRLNAQAEQEYLVPIRPASEGRNPSWNGFSNKFIYAPAFDVPAVEGAAGYRFTIKQKKGQGCWRFTAERPDADLSSVWSAIPPSEVKLTVQALDASGTPGDTLFEREFLRDYPFHAPYSGAVRPYQEAAMMASLFVHKMAAVQHWKDRKEPDMSYAHNTYANKIIGGTISMEARLARLAPSLKGEALAIARNAASFLIAESRPEGTPLAYFPPTYYGSLVSSGRATNAGKMMTMDATFAGMAFLDLFKTTRDSLYLDRALKIASTYARIQRPDGSYPIKVDYLTGEPVNEVSAMLHPLLFFLRRLERSYGITDFRDTRLRAERWMKETALASFDMTGQFEDTDVVDLQPYENLTNCTAAPYASYLLTGAPSEEDIRDARELIAMAEDQFVHWDALPDKLGVRHIATPCVFEQHKYRVPVDNSACNMINAWLDLYNITGDKLAYAKAKALADQLTIVQDAGSGRIPTTWNLRNPESDARRTFWINCTNSSVETLLRMEKYME